MPTPQEVHGKGKCHICGKPKAEAGANHCSYPHGMLPDQELSDGMWSWKMPDDDNSSSAKGLDAMMTAEETELFDGALDVAVQLATSEHQQHKGLGQIIAGLCAMVARREPEALMDASSQQKADGSK